MTGVLTNLDRVKRALVYAARLGQPCPSNYDLATLVHASSPSAASYALKQLEQRGVIRVERFACSRRVTIVATGEATRVDGDPKPHWRDRAPDQPTGAELAAAIHDAAGVRGLRIAEFAAPLCGSNPQAWLANLAQARNPKPATRERIRRLLAGEPIEPLPEPPGDPLRRAGEGKRVLREARAALAAGTDEASVATARRTLARGQSTLNPLPLDRPAPVPAAAADDDPRPHAWSRDPCPRCATRGDLGCAHQRPYVAEGVA